MDTKSCRFWSQHNKTSLVLLDTIQFAVISLIRRHYSKKHINKRLTTVRRYKTADTTTDNKISDANYLHEYMYIRNVREIIPVQSEQLDFKVTTGCLVDLIAMPMLTSYLH